MNSILLTQSSTPIIGPIASLLGYIMEGIFFVIDLIGIPNIGLAIILFTIIVNLLMLPLTIKQQKFSKLQSIMSPEIQAIQNKYKNRKDNESMLAQNQEMQAVYAKYGVSPTGSCLPLLIQMPILFALYKVIYSMPAYVGKIGNTFRVLADKIISVDGAEFLRNSGVESISNTVKIYGGGLNNVNSNTVVDVLNKLSSTDMATVATQYDLNSLTYPAGSGNFILSSNGHTGLIDTYNNFLGLNIGNSPSNVIHTAIEAGLWIMVIAAIMVPLLSALTQWINVKLMPQQNTSGNDQASAMASSMKTMNFIMPIISAWFCYTLPIGMGIYWIAGSVVRSIQQVVINKHIDNMDLDQMIEKNSKKGAKKLEKIQKNQERLNAYASMNTRNIQSKASSYNNSANDSDSNQNTNITKSPAKAGSMMSKANMVKDYNEKNNKN